RLRKRTGKFSAEGGADGRGEKRPLSAGKSRAGIAYKSVCDHARDQWGDESGVAGAIAAAGFTGIRIRAGAIGASVLCKKPLAGVAREWWMRSTQQSALSIQPANIWTEDMLPRRHGQVLSHLPICASDEEQQQFSFAGLEPGSAEFADDCG